MSKTTTTVPSFKSFRLGIRTHTHTHTHRHTHTHTHTHHVKLIAISAPPYYVVGTDNNNWGTWHHQAVELVQEIGRRTANITGDARESDFLFQ